jgi:hypothetical protein
MFVWTHFPFGRPDVPGPARHITYVLGSRTGRASVHYLLAYTGSGLWRQATPSPPIGVIEFDAVASAALNQRPFHIDLRCLARLPPTAVWFPDIGQPGHGVVAVAGIRVRDRIMKAAEALAQRSPRLIEVRGI